MIKKIGIIGDHGMRSTITSKIKEQEMEPILVSNPYIDTLLDSEEMQYYMRHFGAGKLKLSPTQEKIKSWSKEKLREELKLIESKTSKLSRKERDLVTYYATK